MKFKKWKGMALGFIIAAIVVGSGLYLVRNDSCLGSETGEYFQLPSNTKLLESRSIQLSRSCMYWIKFQISPDQLAQFLSTTFIKMPLLSTSPPQAIGGINYLEQETGWQLNSITSYLAGEGVGRGSRYLDEQTIFVDTTDGQQYTVYLTTKRNWL
jgi:hypothetical protein